MPNAVDWRFDPFTESYNAVSKTNEDHVIPGGAGPYYLRLNEVPRKDEPSSVTAVILVELDEDLDVSETAVDVLATHYNRIQVDDVLLCDDEQMLVTSKPGSPTVNVTRGYGGTSADTHSDGTLMEILNSLTEITSGSPATREFRVDYKYNTGLVLFNSTQGGYDVRFDYYGLGTPFSTEIQWARNNLEHMVAGDGHLPAYSDAEETTNSTSPTKLKEIKMTRYGQMRIKFDLHIESGIGTAYGRIYRNGAAIGTQRSTSSTTYQTYSEDLDDWEPDDLIQLYIWSSNALYDAYCRNFRIYIDNPIEKWDVLS